MNKYQEEAIRTLRQCGTKFNIINEVEVDITPSRTGKRVELHFEYEKSTGQKVVHFVAELDGFGNISEAGPYLGPISGGRIGRDLICFNADGDIV